MADNGLIIIDKPGGMTSHDVVARVRRIAGTRKVGHAGTLDPMATGILVIGVERATKLLGYLMGHDKTYAATVRLGTTTVTDDADGEIVDRVDAAHITNEQIRAGLQGQTGLISQVPSAVSAIKVGGRRSYDLVRRGEAVPLTPREVQIHAIEVHDVRRTRGEVDVDIVVRCGSGTYIRAIARDVGAELGVGGHLTALRRTATGDFDESVALSLEELGERANPVVVSLDDAVARSFPQRRVDADEARELSFGRRLTPAGDGDITYGAIDPEGAAVALINAHGKPIVVFKPA
ncbi:tRNA pseudouridine synthase B [Antricoccus suffuscus]|uniref:tRNA pseudouridine synthase B n=1 Tax=Antricoccus suffuscus TaxID=1629062 RepID=A0A2T1A4Q1_9ACTN|nr:tRNA pseudouridine(55) synthase TruB [Antricoccus suffuscus]PRZ43579.1 tRNA pseudouridine synthase B [Antricoccus suffuscus]